MNFRRPLQVVTPTLDGDVLVVLSRADQELTGRDVHRLVGHSSEQGVRRVLNRLVGQGLVIRGQAGRAQLFTFNRQHLAAPHVIRLAGLRGDLIERLRDTIAHWELKPRNALLFGSVARGEATAESDIDLLLIRPKGSADSSVWEDQSLALQRSASGWTGNDARLLEFDEDEIRAHRSGPRVIREALRDGVDLYGTRRELRRLIQAR